jgi:hypothetical protein
MNIALLGKYLGARPPSVSGKATQTKVSIRVKRISAPLFKHDRVLRLLVKGTSIVILLDGSEYPPDDRLVTI